MKKLLFALSFFLFAGVAVQAQSKSCSKSCAKTCASKKTEKTSETKVASAYMEADKIAASDDNIQRRECTVSGTVSYYQKSECAVSGKVTWEEVEFNSEKKAFTKVASASMEKDPATGKVLEKAKCSAKCTKADKAKCSAKSESKTSKA